MRGEYKKRAIAFFSTLLRITKKERSRKQEYGSIPLLNKYFTRHPRRVRLYELLAHEGGLRLYSPRLIACGLFARIGMLSNNTNLIRRRNHSSQTVSVEKFQYFVCVIATAKNSCLHDSPTLPNCSESTRGNRSH
jgi:hypothetical protein